MRRESSKLETRNSKQTRSIETKKTGNTAKTRSTRFSLLSHFSLCVCFGFRISCFGFSLATTLAQEPPPVRIAFVPPPMEGTLSLGVFDKAGKLVRVLAREASEKDFTIGLNGLITQWDGRDDSGKPAPAGTYSVRGYSVGAIQVEGVAYHCNDWMLDDESPRLRRVLGLELRAGGRLVLQAEGADGRPQVVSCPQAGEFTGEIPPDPAEPAVPAQRAVVKDGRVAISEGAKTRDLELPGLAQPLDASLGRDSVWVIDTPAAGAEVKEYSREGDLRRRMEIDRAEPVPRRVFASRTSDLIFLIEESPGLQRVRGLALEAATASEPATSTWKTVLARTITASDSFAVVADKLGRPAPFVPRDKFTVRLQPNELFQNAMTTTDVTIGFDATGSYLQTLDLLPLRRVTATPHLKWAVICQEGSGKQLTIFQSDGAVVEEFRAHKLANMMAFDAGDYEWAPPVR